MKLLRIQIEKQVYYMDQTTIHLWYTTKRTYSTIKEPVALPMRPTRGRSVTVYGIIGGNNGEFIHMTADSTNSANTQAFL